VNKSVSTLEVEAIKEAELYKFKHAWDCGTFVNEFGEPTNKKYIYIDIIGSFSNSATTNSICPVHFLVNKRGTIGIFLYEYGRKEAAYFIGEGKLLMKNAKGEVCKGTITDKWSQGGGLRINSSNVISFLKRSSGFIKVVIRDEYSSEYRFKINANGFTEMWNKIHK